LVLDKGDLGGVLSDDLFSKELFEPCDLDEDTVSLKGVLGVVSTERVACFGVTSINRGDGGQRADFSDGLGSEGAKGHLCAFKVDGLV